MSRKKSTKRLDNAYANYKKRYKEKQTSLRKRGYEMADTMLTRREYEMVRKAYVDNGRKENINQTIVADQAYEYSQKTARQFKQVAEKFDLPWQDQGITELRKGTIDVSAMNNRLKELEENDPEAFEALFAELPAAIKHTRQGFISYEVFGSE